MVVLMVAYGRQQANGQELYNSGIEPLFHVDYVDPSSTPARLPSA